MSMRHLIMWLTFRVRVGIKFQGLICGLGLGRGYKRVNLRVGLGFDLRFGLGYGYECRMFKCRVALKSVVCRLYLFHADPIFQVSTRSKRQSFWITLLRTLEATQKWRFPPPRLSETSVTSRFSCSSLKARNLKTVRARKSYLRQSAIGPTRCHGKKGKNGR